jgi:SM-20-related protein
MSNSPEAIIEVIEDLVSTPLFTEACRVCAGKTWYFGNRSNHEQDIPFWKMDLEGVLAFDEIWRAAQAQCEAISGCKLRVIRQYANGHTYGLGGQAHLDDERPGTFTLLYYPMPEWDSAWQGETVFHDVTGEIAVTVTPRPNRAVFFDARIPHAGRAPSRSCRELRITVAYKLESIPESEISDLAKFRKLGPVESTESAATETTALYKIEEVSSAQEQHTYRISSRADQVQATINERLQELSQTLRVPGHRPGKIPLDVLQTRYGAKTRKEVTDRIFERAAAEILAKGGLAASFEMLEGAESGPVSFQLTATQLAELPDPQAEHWKLEKLTVPSASDLTEKEISTRLAQHFQTQVLDRLDAAYRFPIAPPLIAQELDKILKSLPPISPGEDSKALLAEWRDLAERRVRLGAILIELARRHCLVASHDQTSVERLVIDWLTAQAQMIERPATAADFTDVA